LEGEEGVGVVTMSEKKVVTFEGDDLKVITFGGKKI